MKDTNKEKAIELATRRFKDDMQLLASAMRKDGIWEKYSFSYSLLNAVAEYQNAEIIKFSSFLLKRYTLVPYDENVGPVIDKLFEDLELLYNLLQVPSYTRRIPLPNLPYEGSEKN